MIVILTDPKVIARRRFAHWTAWNETLNQWEAMQHRRAHVHDLEAQLASSVADEARTQGRRWYRQEVAS